jgi:hypothetical protein
LDLPPVDGFAVAAGYAGHQIEVLPETGCAALLVENYRSAQILLREFLLVGL